MHALDALVGPVGVLVGRADEQDVAARGVGADALDDRRRRDDVARDLLIFAPSLVTIPCVNSAWNGSWKSRWPRSASALVKKRAYIRCRIACSTPPMYWSTGIHSRSAAGSQAAWSLRGVAVAQEVPGGVHERVHRVGLAPRRPAAVGAARCDPVLGRRQRRAALRRVVLDVRQLDRQLVVGHRHHAAALAVDDRDRAAPVALARDEPVAQPVVDRRVALALAVEPRDDLTQRLAVAHAVEVGV